jgi:hypothetical protein
MSDLIADISDSPTPQQRRGRPRGRWRRVNRPEHLVIAGEKCTRNDIKAKQLGGSERALNRGDKNGAPYLYVNGVKYRPERYDDWLLSQIQTNKPTPRRHRPHKT